MSPSRLAEPGPHQLDSPPTPDDLLLYSRSDQFSASNQFYRFSSQEIMNFFQFLMILPPDRPPCSFRPMSLFSRGRKTPSLIETCPFPSLFVTSIKRERTAVFSPSSPPPHRFSAAAPFCSTWEFLLFPPPANGPPPPSSDRTLNPPSSRGV